MKYIKYLFFVIPLILILETNSEIRKNHEKESIEWENINRNYKNNQKDYLRWDIIPKDKNNLENYIKWQIVPRKGNIQEILNDFEKISKNTNKRILSQKIYEINPILPLNNFINKDNITSKVEWKSSFGGGKSLGTGQQNNSFKVDYGLGNFTQLSAIFAEADDDTYNDINGVRTQYSLQSYALSLKQKIWDSKRLNSSISLVSAIEYLKISSGSKKSKSIFNQENNSIDKDKFGKIIYSFSLPYKRKITRKLTYNFVPGYVFLPNKLGSRTNKNNFYGNNLYIGNGITFDLLDDLTLHGSFTNPLGPGSNYFDKSLNFSRKPIYSFGLNWAPNHKIILETQITNGYGSTPSTGLLTIPSDNVLLYAANLKYLPYGEDTILKPLNKRDILLSFGGITVNNALIPKNGTQQINVSFDSNGNYHGSYYYSLSNIFQLELLNVSRINKVNNEYLNQNFTNKYVDKHNFNLRLGGKLLLFSPQKDDILWTSFRTSLGRNESTNQGYIFSELINTLRVNNFLAANISSKYFLTNRDKFSSIGSSLYINLTDNFQLIPEANFPISKKLKANNSISLRYKPNNKKSIDFYVSNALGLKDLNSTLKDNNYKYGLKINLFY